VEKNSVTALIMATLMEAKPFVLGMSLTQLTNRPFKVFKNDNIILVISGIGKANAGMAAMYCNMTFEPACIINLGAAGGLDNQYPLGEIRHINKVIEPDRPLFNSDEPRTFIPDILDGFDCASLATQDTAVLDPDIRKELSLNAELADMEGAAVVQACKKTETKCYLFKFVSDTPDHTDGDDIVKYIRKFRMSFYEFILDSVIRTIGNSSCSNALVLERENAA